eukprot:117309_1
MFLILLFAFGGNTFDAIYAISNLFKVECFGFKGLAERDREKNDRFTKTLGKKINIFNSVVTPEIHLMYKQVNSRWDLEIWETFQQVNEFPINISCYLIENMFVYGIEGLALNFTSYMKLQYGAFGKLIETSGGFDFDGSDVDTDNDDDVDYEELEEQIMAKLYSFNDTESMNKLFLQFLNELKSNQIILKQNEQ